LCLNLDLPQPILFMRKLHWKELLALLFILLAIFFFRQERNELAQLIPAVKAANSFWVWCGIFITVVYIFLQAALYVFSFATVHGQINWFSAIELFVKRNLISVFLPAGGISSLAYLPKTIKDERVNKQQVHQASAVYAFVGIFSVFLVGIPVFIFLLASREKIKGALSGFVALSVLLLLVLFIVNSIRSKNRLYLFTIKKIPKLENLVSDFFSFRMSKKKFWTATFFSVLIEFAGIAHLMIAMKAAGLQPNFEAAAVGYIVATIFLIISPFLRGLGAIELSLTIILQAYHFSLVQAFVITILFRVFEFWLPLLAGVISFALRGKDLFLRLFPPVMIFLLGVINIISVLTPPIASRVRILKEYIPVSSLETSNLLVILMGLMLIIVAHSLVRGLRSAWLLALVISIASGIGHLVKALDYEEALAALFVTVVLLLTAKQYGVKSNSNLVNVGIITGAATFLVVLIFGSIGFYFLNKKHFGIDFTWQQSIQYAVRTFGLLSDGDLNPLTQFAKEFLFFIKGLGVASWIFLFYTIVRPAIDKVTNIDQSLEKAQYLLKQYGDSALDYFKIGSDKLLYISDNYEAFVSYRIANGFAVVLEEPVCSEGNKRLVLEEFEEMCKTKGLKPVYYRVEEDSLYHFKSMNKKKLLIGQEGILETYKFSLEGRERKSLRNAMNSLMKKGYKVQVNKAPQSGLVLQALQQVSDEFLRANDMEELVFSQGSFDWNELRSQDIITISDADKKIVGFLNIIPDYNPNECTYDMIRKTNDAPGGCMDVLIIELIKYAKEKGYQYLNFGLAPMSGIEIPDSTAERVVKLAYEKIKRFRHYQGLRDFKEKFVTKWQNKYLVYKNDFDLIQLPAVLNKVMLPVNKGNKYAK
jgi:phosphatidylglycerol lysyltransferase